MSNVIKPSHITKIDISKIYKISIRTFDRYRNELEIKSFKNGKFIIFDREEVERKIPRMIELEKKQTQKCSAYPKFKNNSSYITKPLSDNSTRIIPNESSKDIIQYLDYLKSELETNKKILDEKNQMLESANYKVGKLEALNNLNTKLIGENESYKLQTIELENNIQKQKKEVWILQTLFYSLMSFISILVIFEIFLFYLLMR